MCPVPTAGRWVATWRADGSAENFGSRPAAGHLRDTGRLVDHGHRGSTIHRRMSQWLDMFSV